MSRGRHRKLAKKVLGACPDCGRAFLSPADELARVKAQVEAARLAKIEADAQDWPPKGIAYEDLPPPHPEDAIMLREKLQAKLDMLADNNARMEGEQ